MLSERQKRPSQRSRTNAYNGKNSIVVHLYVAYCEEFAKIGVTENVRGRIKSMQSGCPYPIELLSSFALSKDDAIRAENEVALELDSDHWIGEWFKCSREHAVDAAITVIGKLSQSYEQNTNLKDCEHSFIDTICSHYRETASFD